MAFAFTSPTITSPNLSLADALTAVQTRDLPKRRKQDMASALRTDGRVLGKPLERIPAHPRLLAAQLKKVAPLAFGLSLRRWANVRSLTHAAIALIRPTSPGRHLNPLLPGWQALLDQLETEATGRMVSRFSHFCSAEGIEPQGVRPDTFDEFRRYLDDTPLIAPDQVFSMTARGWRKAQETVESWPRTTVPIPARGRRWTMQWKSFPPSLRRDFENFRCRRLDDDPFEEEPSRPLRATTLATREWQLRAFASALVLCGYDPAKLTSLRDLTEIEAFKNGLRFLRERWNRQSDGLFDLACALKAIARHHVGVDADHLSQMGRIIRKLEPNRNGLTETNRERLRPFDSERNAIKLRDLPLMLMRLAAHNPRPARAAVQAQIAVAIEILFFTRMRIRNLAGLDLERNFRPGPDDELYVVVEAEDVKNRNHLECPLPQRSVQIIDQYLREFRPRLAPPDCTALFPGRSGKPKNKNWLSCQITRTIHVHTGLTVNPHLFRHITSKLYLDRYPGGYEVVRRVLGHRSIQTTISSYTGLETAAAARHFDRTLLDMGNERDQAGEDKRKHGTRRKQMTRKPK
jgi:integrase